MVKIRKINKDVKKISQKTSSHLLVSSGRLKTTELSGHGSLKDTMDASQVCSPSDSQSRREKLPLTLKEVKEKKKVTSLFVPVISKTGKVLMPCHPARARELLRKGKAVRRFKTGFFYLQLLHREDGNVQRVALGIDPGSKREGFTVKSEKHTFLNVLSDSVSWVKESIEVRKNMRISRRSRKTPCRKNKYNRSIGSISPSTKARWQLKLRIVNILRKLYPIVVYSVEDICAVTKKGKRKWNMSFSSIETGKNWFYFTIKKFGELKTIHGYETKKLRDLYGLKKTTSKLNDCFSAHNVDSWVLANSVVGGHTKPDNEKIVRLIPLQFHRRQLHAFQPAKGNIRKNYGGTMSNGLKRGSLVKHKKHGICYLGGFSKKTGLTLHDLNSNKRISRDAKNKDIIILSYNYFRWYNV